MLLVMTADPAASRHGLTDCLRGIAILLVLVLHFHLSYRLTRSPLADLLGETVVRRLAGNGNYGVTIFFAISGFLITQTALHRWVRLADISLRGFYTLRAARILPPLLLALAIIVPLGLAGHPSFRNARHPEPEYFFVAAGSVLTFWHNLLMQSVGYFNYALNIYWSLSVEEAFYLGFPVLCVLLKRARWVVATCCLLIVAGPSYRYLHRDNEIFFMYANLACFDAIAMGVVAALAARQFTPSPLLRRLTQGFGAAVIAITYGRGIGGHEVFRV